MKADCHIHMVLDGYDWRSAILRHTESPDDAFIHKALSRYQQLGYTYLRDGGDRWGAGKRAREFSPQYGITYRTPLSPIHRKGHYGGFIGTAYETPAEFKELVLKTKAQGGDFIKIMISGLMNFDRFGVLTEPSLPAREIRQLIHIAHSEGMAVMVHGNGARAVEAAADAGAESVEHGAYLDADALAAMVERGTVWVPTLSTVGNLRGTGRFSETDVAKIFENTCENLSRFKGFVAAGTDAGAWSVPHGVQTEEALLEWAGIPKERIEEGNHKIQSVF